MKRFTLLLLMVVSVGFAQPGTIDTSLNVGLGPDNAVTALATQPDGKILIGGAFTSYNGTTRNGLARLNADGSLDASFTPGGIGVGEEIYSIALQSDGKMIIAGYFSEYDGTPRNHVARVNSDGSLDVTFDIGTGANDYIMGAAVQSDGKVVLGGFFTQFNGVGKNRIVRLNTDGSIDNTFNMGTGANQYVYTLSVLPDDKIYIGGGFINYNGTPCSHLTRLNPDGTLDTSFFQGTLGNNSVLTHAVQPDGKIMIAGYFTGYGVYARSGIARLLENGQVDSTFSPGSGISFTGGRYPTSLVAQPNGKIVLGGYLNSYNGNAIGNIVRLNDDGSIDSSFQSGTGFNSAVYTMRFEANGKIMVGSGATAYNGNSAYPFLTRLNGYADNEIAVTSVDEGPYCPGQTINVDFTADGYYAAGNVFTAELSDGTGSFASPVAIGTLSATTGGSIIATIPVDAIAASACRIRVVSSDLSTVGSDNGSDLEVSAMSTYYADADGDGFGDPAESIQACAEVEGYVTNSDDCDDADANINPDADEIPGNGIDDNCDGNIDDVIVTQIVPLQCGSTLAAVSTVINATAVPGATAYRFEVTNTITNSVQTIVRTVPNFRINQLVYAYSTSYSIRVELQMAGEWLGYYGPACTVSTPDVTGPDGAAQLVGAQCGVTLATMNTLIATTSLPGIATYRFRVTDLTDTDGPNQIQTIDRTLHWFSLAMLPRFNYGTTYSVEVAVKTATGDFTTFGQPCAVTTPAVPGLKLCNSVIATNQTQIATTSTIHATTYRFEVTNLSTLAVEIIDTPTYWFKLSMVPGLTPSTDYEVRVALMTTGEFSPYGQPCVITSPASARGESKTEMVAFDAVAYPNPFSGSFRIALSGAADNVNVKVYDMTGRLVDARQIDALSAESLEWGQVYPAGVYQMVLTSGNQAKTVRMIKR